MNLNIPFSELISLIKAKTGQDVTVSRVADDTVKCGFVKTVKLPIVGERSMGVDLNLTIKQLVGEDLHLQYEGGIGKDQLIEMALAAAKRTPHGKLFDTQDGRRIILHLGQIPQIRQALQQLDIRRVSFVGDAASAEFVLK